MQFHDYANLFPMMPEEDLRSLAEDIRANGLHQPIVVYQGKILDGRNRWRACELAGVEPQVCDAAGVMGDGDAARFVVSLNLHRRHLSQSQLATVARDLLPVFEAEAKERQKASGGDRKSAAAKSVVAKLPQPISEGLDQSAFTAAVEPLIEAVDSQVERLGESLGLNKARDLAAAAVGVSPRMVSDAKALSLADPEEYEKVKTGEKSLQEAKRDAKNKKRRAEHAERAAEGTPALPAATSFGVILADPPWRYEHSVSKSRAVENHYPTMSLEEICGLGVEAIAAADCVLFLWATSPKLAESLQVIAAWGFKYRTSMVWKKTQIGPGYYVRQQHELLLIATRGKPGTPLPESKPRSVITAPREEHSRKPEVFRELIETMYPLAAKVELFCRSPRAGWAVWGNEVCP